MTFPSWATIKLAVGALAFGLLTIALVVATGEARHWKKTAEHTADLRVQDQRTWREAYHKATYEAVLNSERTRLARAKIDERIVHALAADRDSAAAGYDRLRRSAEAYRRTARDPDLSAELESACRAFAATPCDEIPALLKAAQDNTDQLLRLIEAVKAQGEVPTVAPVSVEAAGQ